MSIYFELPLALLAGPALALWAWWLSRNSGAYLPPGRRKAALVVRLAVSLMLPLALARPVLVWAAPGTDVVFLVDRSASIGPRGAMQSDEWLQAAMERRGQHDRVAVVTFGGSASVEQALERTSDLPRLSGRAENPHRTDLGAAIRSGLGLLAPDTPRRLVLLSDGQENLGSAREAARLAAAAGVPIDFVPIGQPLQREVSALLLDTPPLLREGERFSATLMVSSTVHTLARLVITSGGRLLAAQEVALSPGVNRFVLPVESLKRGTHVFRAEVEPEDDTFPANNLAGSVSVVSGPPSVLLVEGSEGAATFLAEALAAAELEVQVSTPTTTPWESAALRRHQAIVLVDVPAESLPPGQQQVLREYVQSFGGGLVVVGGEQSYGPGGYARTALESMLPVRMDLRGRTLSTSVALMLVVDASGSMGAGPEGATRMDLAKEAAIAAGELLGEFDYIGVVAFEDRARWIAPLQPASDLATLMELIARMQPGGGTDVYAGLVEAYPPLAAMDAKVKHIILLSDGETPQRDWEGLAARMREANITLSTIAIGDTADRLLMQRLAEMGDGRYYEGNDPFDLPRVIVKETIQVQRAAVVEEDFHPIRLARSPVTEELDFLAAPPLRGYVATSPKPGANVLLVSRQLDPVLAEWQYGLGRVLAWTSDARNRWSAFWLDGWPEFSRFWSQIVRRAARPPDDPNRSLQVSIDGAHGVVRLEAQSDERSYLNFLPSSAVIQTPSGEALELPLPQVAPGAYEGRFPLTDDGAYLVQAIQNAGESVATQSGGLVQPYSPEFRALGVNRQLLEEIAARTGGSELQDPAEAFRSSPAGARLGQASQLWPWLTALAALLFLADVAVRRLRLEQIATSPAVRRLRARWTAFKEPRPSARRAPAYAAAVAAPTGTVRAARGDSPPSPVLPAGEAPMASAGRLLAAKQRAARR